MTEEPDNDKLFYDRMMKHVVVEGRRLGISPVNATMSLIALTESLVSALEDMGHVKSGFRQKAAEWIASDCIGDHTDNLNQEDR